MAPNLETLFTLFGETNMTTQTTTPSANAYMTQIPTPLQVFHGSMSADNVRNVAELYARATSYAQYLYDCENEYVIASLEVQAITKAMKGDAFDRKRDALETRFRNAIDEMLEQRARLEGLRAGFSKIMRDYIEAIKTEKTCIYA
jgi:hypothetical protein